MVNLGSIKKTNAVGWNPKNRVFVIEYFSLSLDMSKIPSIQQ